MATILLIDDSELAREIMKEILMEAGHTVLTTADPNEFLRLLHAQPRPQLVIVDAVMPEVSGASLIGSIRAMADPELAHLPIIMATALSDQTPPAPGILMLSKPFTMAELQTTVKFALG